MPNERYRILLLCDVSEYGLRKGAILWRLRDGERPGLHVIEFFNDRREKRTGLLREREFEKLKG